MDKTIVNFTPTGLIPRKSDSPYVPVTPSEIITDVKKAYELGITMVHLHAREPETGIPTHKKEIYGNHHRHQEFAPDLIICVSLRKNQQ